MSNTTSNISGMLLEVYKEGTVENLINTDAKLLKRLKKADKKLAGSGLFAGVKVANNERGVGAISESGALHTPGFTDVQKAKIYPKIQSAQVEFTGLALAMGANNTGAFVNDKVYELNETLKTAGRDTNDQLYRDGTGIIAKVNGASSSSTTITFDNGNPFHFRPGMYIDVINASDSKQVDSIKIVAVNPFSSSPTLTMASAVSCDDNSNIFREDISSVYAGSALEMTGLKLVCDNGTISTSFENVNRTTYNAFDGLTLDANGANFSDDIAQDAISRVKAMSGTAPDLVIMNPAGQMRKYLSILTPFKSFSPKEKMDSGVDGPVPTLNGLEVLEDTSCGLSDVFVINTNDVKMYWAQEFDWVKGTDGSLLRTTGYDKYTAAMIGYGDLGSLAPNKNVYVKNLATPTYSY